VKGTAAWRRIVIRHTSKAHAAILMDGQAGCFTVETATREESKYDGGRPEWVELIGLVESRLFALNISHIDVKTFCLPLFILPKFFFYFVFIIFV